MAQDDVTRDALRLAAPVMYANEPDSVEAQLTALHNKDIEVEMRLAKLEESGPAEYNFGRDLLVRLSSRKLWAAITGVAITGLLVLAGQVSGDEAVKAVAVILGGYTAVEGGADIAGRITGK